MKRIFLMTPKAKFSAAVVLALAFVALSTVPTANADPFLLAPGGTISSPLALSSAGAVVATTGPVAFAFGADAGTVIENVIQDAITNGLDFTYQVTVTAGMIGRVNGSNFAGYTTDVGFGVSSGGTVAPVTITRSTDGNIVGFWFIPEFSSATSYLLEVNTNAQAFSTGTIGLIDTIGGGASGFTPANVNAPEPAPTTLLLVGLGVLALFASTGLGKKISPVSA